MVLDCLFVAFQSIHRKPPRIPEELMLIPFSKELYGIKENRGEPSYRTAKNVTVLLIAIWIRQAPNKEREGCFWTRTNAVSPGDQVKLQAGKYVIDFSLGESDHIIVYDRMLH